MAGVYRRQCQDRLLITFYISLTTLSGIQISSTNICITCRGISFQESKNMASAFLVGLGLATSAFLVSERMSVLPDSIVLTILSTGPCRLCCATALSRRCEQGRPRFLQGVCYRNSTYRGLEILTLLVTVASNPK